LDFEAGSIESSIIHSPMIQPSFVIGQHIAFIDNKIDVVPGRIAKVNNDGTFNLRIYIPLTKSRIKFEQVDMSFSRKEKPELVEQERLRARFADPHTLFRKNIIPLNDPNQRGLDGIVQTHVNVFTPVGMAPHLRMHEFHTSLIGTFFDPTIYNYRVYCWRAPIEVQGTLFPSEERSFPKAKPFYADFAKAYDRFFEEYHLGRSKSGIKWNRVEIMALEKES
jgi:hypothetical protein